MPEFPPYEAKEKKNYLLKMLRNKAELNYEDFAVDNIEPIGEFVGWKIYLKEKPEYYFVFREVIPHINAIYTPNTFNHSIIDHKHSKASGGNAWPKTQEDFENWMNAMIREKVIDDEERELHEALNPITILSPEAMAMPFKDEREKLLLTKGIKEFKFRIAQSRTLNLNQKEKFYHVAEVTEEEIKNAKTVKDDVEEQEKETKQRIYDRFKIRINNILNGVKEYLITPVLEGFKDGVKEATKQIVKGAIIGGVTIGSFSLVQKMDVFIAIQNSMHVIELPNFSLPIPSNVLPELKQFQFDDQIYFDEESIDSKPKSFWKKLFGN